MRTEQIVFLEKYYSKTIPLGDPYAVMAIVYDKKVVALEVADESGPVDKNRLDMIFVEYLFARAQKILDEKEANLRKIEEERGLVRMEADSMAWVIHAKLLDQGPYEEPWVELSWGWTAGMSKEELSKLADDCPKGEESVKTTLRDIPRLQKTLADLVKEAESWPPRLPRPRTEFDDYFDELMREAREKPQSQ